MILNTFYNLLLLILVAVTCPVWLVWMVRVPKIRAGFWDKCGFLPREFKAALKALPEENRVWLHAVSVGEFNAARPLIARFQQAGYPVVISCTTLTGYTLASKTYPTVPVFYFPFDFLGLMRKTFRLISPQLAVVMETEIWPNYLYAAHEQKIPVVLVNGRLSEKSFRGYSRLRFFLKPILKGYTRLLMQSEGDAERMIALGAEASKVVVTGNIKFDAPPMAELTEKQAVLKACFNWSETTPVCVFASTHPGEEEIMLEILKNLKSAVSVNAVLAPRHPERADEVAGLLTSLGFKYVRRSELSPEHPASPDTEVILLDTVGELMAVFSLSTVACMGGTFVPWGGHNPLEPIMMGIPVVFGPSMKNFKDIARIVTEAGAGIQVENATEAWAHLEQLIINPKHYQAKVENGRQLLAQHSGVTERIFEVLQSLV